MRRHFQFLKHFFRNPNKVGAVTALNDAVIEEITKHIKQAIRENPIKILEVGAGYGNISKYLIKLITKDDRLDIIEIDSNCCEYLNKKFSNLPMVNIHCGSIQQWDPSYSYDYIISTIPFNSYPTEFVKSVLDRYEKLSKKGTICSYVEYAGLQKIRKSFAQDEAKAELNSRQELLDAFQKKYLFDKECVLSNIPPCNVYHLKLG